MDLTFRKLDVLATLTSIGGNKEVAQPKHPRPSRFSVKAQKILSVVIYVLANNPV